MSENLIGKFQGCLLGQAIGDALGAPVEFLSRKDILATHGRAGITGFKPWGRFKPGTYTDDTQMTLATAVGLLRARPGREGNPSPTPAVYRRYLEWLETQKDENQRRGPGSTCLSALQSGRMGTMKSPPNDSKGCGGVMRTAPAGLAFPPEVAFRFGAEFAAITHGHPSGFLSAGFLSGLIAHLVEDKNLDQAINLTVEILISHPDHRETLEKVEQALKLARKRKPVESAVETLGEGWVGEEALAIALYSSLKFSTDFRAGVLAAANHSGDSDSTGAIAGAILGTFLGIEAIPPEWAEEVENAEKIRKIADAMFSLFRKGETISSAEYPPEPRP